MSDQIRKQRLHPAWTNVIALCMIMAGTFGLVVNCIGVLFAAIMEDTGISNGDLSLYYTIRNLTSAAVVVFTVKLFLTNNARLVMAALCLIMALSVGAMAFFHKTYQWYIAGIFTGIGQSCIYTITPIVINNWFAQRRGFALGLSMSASGLFSTIFSPIVSALILEFGWRTSCILLMFISMLVTLPACLFLLRRDCEGSGWEPLGHSEAPDQQLADQKSGMSLAIPGTLIFITLMVYSIFGSMYAPINHQVAVFGNSIGFGLTFGALLTSCTMVGNIVGKLFVGALSDKIGIFHALRLSLVLVFVGLLLFCLCTGHRFALMIGAFFYGITYAFVAAQSMLILAVYGPEHYKQKLAPLQSVSGIVGALMSSVVGYLYDYFQSFSPIFIFTMCFCVAQILICTYLSVYTKKRKALAAKLS